MGLLRGRYWYKSSRIRITRNVFNKKGVPGKLSMYKIETKSEYYNGYTGVMHKVGEDSMGLRSIHDLPTP